jgi:catalase
MAMHNPVGRANYEPNSWPADQRGPREDPVNGFQSFAAAEAGDSRRVRAELFGDHYSQARLFLTSQTPTEQTHIVNAFVFELSKVERADIRARMVANLRNVDEGFAAAVSDGLGLALPAASTPARPPITDLPPSPALSILENSPMTFTGRKLGILVTDGTDARVLAGLTAAAEAEGAVVELIAPKIGGIVASDKTNQSVHHKIDGAPSVLYDAVALIPSASGAAILAAHGPAKDFVNDAHAHCKFVGYNAASQALFQAAGLSELMDGGYVALDAKKTTAANFIKTCRRLRFWDREPTVQY